MTFEKIATCQVVSEKVTYYVNIKSTQRGLIHVWAGTKKTLFAWPNTKYKVASSSCLANLTIVNVHDKNRLIFMIWWFTMTPKNWIMDCDISSGLMLPDTIQCISDGWQAILLHFTKFFMAVSTQEWIVDRTTLWLSRSFVWLRYIMYNKMAFNTCACTCTCTHAWAAIHSNVHHPNYVMKLNQAFPIFLAYIQMVKAMKRGYK